MTPPLTLVQPTTRMPAHTPMHPNQRATEALHTAIQASWQDGHGRGERIGYLQGWRSGLLCGMCWGGIAAGAVALGAHLLGLW